MEPGQGKERRREQVRANRDAVGVHPRVLRHLASQKDRAQDDTRHPPAQEAPPVIPLQAPLGEIHRPTAGEQEETEDERSRNIEIVRTRTRTARAVLDETDDQRAEERRLAEDECKNAHDRRAPLPCRIRLGFDRRHIVLQIPQRPSAPNRWQGDEVVRRWW